MKCEHCKLDFKDEALIKENEHYFCCKGCAFVYELLKEKKLTSFYDKLGKNTLNPVNMNAKINNYQSFVQRTEEGFSLIYLIISDMHCQACVWLNERFLKARAGILELDINSINNKVRIVFDDSVVSLEEILGLIISIGYTPCAYDRLEQDKKEEARKRSFYSKLIVALACLMNIMWIAVAKYAGLFSGMSADIKDVLNFAEFVLCSPILFFTGSSFFSSALRAMKLKQVNMDTLVISGASLGYLYSIWAMFTRNDEVYFDSVAMIISFVFIGKYLELLSKKKASDTLDSLNILLASEVLIKEGEKTFLKDVKEVKIGEIIEAKSGDKILIDGECIGGKALLDLSSLSGEALNIEVEEKSFISSAALVSEGCIWYKSTKSYEDSKLMKLINLIEKAAFKKAGIELLANKLSSYFSSFVLALAFFTLVFWGFDKEGFVRAISVLIIACPCALALATPVCNIIALGSLLKKKILFKKSDLLESLNKCKCVVFDKTGILTDKIEVVKASIKSEELLYIYSLFKLSLHPLAYEALNFLKNTQIKGEDFFYEKKEYEKKSLKGFLNLELLSFDSFESFAGKGLRAKKGEDIFIAGNLAWLEENGIFGAFEQGSSLFYAKNKELKASFYFESSLRAGVLELIAFLKKRAFKLVILSGDNEKAVEKVAKELGISEYKGACLPEDKLQFLKSLGPHTLMIGDGVNDAASLKYAPISASIKAASKLAIDSSDILLLNNAIIGLKAAFTIARKSTAIIRQNLALSLIYNALTMPLAFFGFLNPLFAALSMSLSSLIVILNALRIKNE